MMRNESRRPDVIREISRTPYLVRADAAPSLTDINNTVRELRTTFEQFRVANDQRLAEVAKGREDVVTQATVDTLNSRLTDLDRELRGMNERLALSSRSTGTGRDATPEARAHALAFGNYVRRGVDNGLQDLAIKASLSTDSNQDGGYTVPVELDRNISRVAAQRNGFRSVAGVVQIGNLAYNGLHNVGGASSGWVSERGTRAGTDTPHLVAISIPANEMYANPAATQGMLDDSFLNVDAWLEEEIAIAFADLEGAAFVNGDGVGKPRGFLKYTFAASTIAAPSAWERVGYTPTGQSGAFASSGPADCLLDLVYSVKTNYRNNAKWLTSDAGIAAARKLKDGQGNYLLEPKINATGANFTLMGYDVVPDDNMPALSSNSYSFGFGDWSRFYKIVDRMGTRVLRDPYSSKPYVMFYTTKRVGGGVHDFHAAKFLKFGSS